jgi:hypothetical protein
VTISARADDLPLGMSFPTLRPGFILNEVVGDDGQPVLVPRHEKPIVATLPERAKRLREHLAGVLWTPRPTAGPERHPRLKPESFAAQWSAQPARSARAGEAGTVPIVRFSGERLARMRQARPEMNASAIRRLCDKRVLAVGYAGSCIFHGKSGCTLDRPRRSDVCNSNICGGLHSYLASREARTLMVVIAGDGMRSSPVLIQQVATDRIDLRENWSLEIGNRQRT